MYLGAEHPERRQTTRKPQDEILWDRTMRKWEPNAVRKPSQREPSRAGLYPKAVMNACRVSVRVSDWRSAAWLPFTERPRETPLQTNSKVLRDNLWL